MWVIFPKWKYGPEESYLVPGTPMNRVVLKLMNFLLALNSTWKIAVWYGWAYRLNASDILSSYNSLPDELKKLYAAWIDDDFVEVPRTWPGTARLSS